MDERKRIVLMVDDVKLNHAIARKELEEYYELYTVESAAEAFEILKEVHPDLILLDVYMPDMSGMEMLDILKANPRYKNIPVIFLTANTSSEAEIQGFNKGIADYITKPFVGPVMRRRIDNQIMLAEYEKSLEEKVNQKVEEIEKMYNLITLSFASLVESRDGVTGGHLKNTSIYFNQFIDYLKELPEYKEELKPSLVKRACRSAPLHDVGKIGVKDAVLQKPDALNNIEYMEMKQHAVIGGEIFDYLETQIPDKEFAKVASHIAKYHHERWDGKGYPEGLAGTEIPLVARIMSVVDVYDALTSERPYKEAYSHEKAMGMIASGSGTQFDPQLVEHFVNISAEIKKCLTDKEKLIQDKTYFMTNKKKENKESDN